MRLRLRLRRDARHRRPPPTPATDARHRGPTPATDARQKPRPEPEPAGDARGRSCMPLKTHTARAAVVFTAKHRRAVFWRASCCVCCDRPLYHQAGQGSFFGRRELGAKPGFLGAKVGGLGGARPVAEPKRTEIAPCFGPWASFPVFGAKKKATSRQQKNLPKQPRPNKIVF